MADEEVTETVETETVETETETVAPVTGDDEPPAWFKKHLAEQEKTKTVTKTAAPKPTKTAAPAAKKTPPAVTPASTEGNQEPAPRKRSGVSRGWFGKRADES